MKNPHIQVDLVNLAYKTIADPHKSCVIGTGPMPIEVQAWRAWQQVQKGKKLRGKNGGSACKGSQSITEFKNA